MWNFRLLNHLTWHHGTVWSGFCSPGNNATYFLNKITPKLTRNPMLHPETANMEFEKVTANQSATLKAGLKANLGIQTVFKALFLHTTENG